MKACDLTLPTPEENLACDEALLDLCEAGQEDEILRLWEPAQTFVVLGYANCAAREVDLASCRQNGIRVLRRCTGGGAVLQGRGCLNYSLVLRVAGTEALKSISGTNDFVMRRHQEALRALLNLPVERKGHTDLTIGERKFSGNSQRRRQRCLLFHGCFLLNLDLDQVARALPLPSRQPEYRAGREHREFLMNLECPAKAIRAALVRAWNGRQLATEVPQERIDELVAEKYGRDDWNLKF